MTEKLDRQKAAEIVRDAGGEIVGRTKLQKVAYLLELAGFGEGFPFSYRHYGPYSENLADAIRMADAFGLVVEEERQASWGGGYSIYRATDHVGLAAQTDRAAFARVAASVDSVELELAATAAYLAAVENSPDPWGETARRKPEKANGERMERAKAAYRLLRELKTDQPLPNIV
ncbi:hypothetical protein JHL17_20060 [Azospirillum sp. YIM B02556]|uniref:Uncharacterized protein n=1 Tax=Azospirillum endophyticum TaxID=2800326 RepID=A0ABS1F8E1_9PROT|nr:hypothetical protein [Azospirillum endophyticum]MBK1839709.1 hypothetical protein [Azospirillum endophyticum]